MRPRKKKANRQRQEEEEVPVIPNWSELCPDLLRCVFKRLSFTELNRAKSVCSSWHATSRGCVPKPNQIPWLILFPRKEEGSCLLFVPEDKKKVYKTRNLRLDFVKNQCLATYSSWLLMSNPFGDIYILNPLTNERIDLPETKNLVQRIFSYPIKACFWIDSSTRDYLVVLMMDSTVFSNKGDNKWHEISGFQLNKEIFYNHKNQKLYIYHYNHVKVWDLSRDKPRKDGTFEFNHYVFPYRKTRIAVTVSGDVLNVTCLKMQKSPKTWVFCIYKENQVAGKWVKIDSLGDEALMLDMGVTVVAKNIPGVKRNSIYVSGRYLTKGRDDPKRIFVYDLTTQKIEPLPKCVSSIPFYDARWFFPGFSG